MEKKKVCVRKLALLLVFVVLVYAFGACTNKDNGTNVNDTTTKTTSTTKPKEEEKPQLLVLMPNISVDPNTTYMAKILEERTGYKIIYELLPVENPFEALNLKVASGESYDVISHHQGVRTYLEIFAREKAIIQLDSLIEEYGNHIKAGASEIVWDITKVDGHYYYLTGVNAQLTPGGNMWDTFTVRQDWLDKLALNYPETTDELISVLREFRDKDPGGNGDKNIPLGNYGSNWSPMKSVFGLYNRWNDVDGKLVADIADPSYKDFLNYMIKLYSEGLLDPEFPTNTQATIVEKFTSGRTGLMIYPRHSLGNTIIDPMATNIPEAKIDVFPPLKNENGVRKQGASAGLNMMAAIPTASENQVHAFKWLNLKTEPETFKMTVIGEKGIHYEEVDGRYRPLLPKFSEDMNLAFNFIFGPQQDSDYWRYWAQVRAAKDPRLVETNTKIVLNNPGMEVTDLLALTPVLPKYANLSPSLNQLVDDFTIKIIAGAEPISSLDDFIIEWRKAGGAEVEKEVNEWYANK